MRVILGLNCTKLENLKLRRLRCSIDGKLFPRFDEESEMNFIKANKVNPVTATVYTTLQRLLGFTVSVVCTRGQLYIQCIFCRTDRI